MEQRQRLRALASAWSRSLNSPPKQRLMEELHGMCAAMLETTVHQALADTRLAPIRIQVLGYREFLAAAWQQQSLEADLQLHYTARKKIAEQLKEVMEQGDYVPLLNVMSLSDFFAKWLTSLRASLLVASQWHAALALATQQCAAQLAVAPTQKKLTELPQ